MSRKAEDPDEAAAESEPLAEVRRIKKRTAVDDKADSQRARHIVTGAAIGIGSAALVAALLYATRGRRNEPGGRS